MPYSIEATLDENSPRVSQPKRINIPLKEHQKSVIYKARKLENLTPISIGDNQQLVSQFGVICDHVGAGKSYEVLGIIASKPSLNERTHLTPLVKGKEGYTLYSDRKEKKKLDTNVIAVPHGVFKQWKDYIEKNTDLNVYCVNTFKALKDIVKDYQLDDLYDESEPLEDPLVDSILGNTRSFEIENGKVKKPSKPLPRDTKYYRYLDLYYEEHPEKEAIIDQYGSLDVDKLKGKDIVLVSSTMYNELAFYMVKDNYYVNRLIFDEADSINIPSNIRIDSIFYWFVTSSVDSLCNPDGIEKVVKEKKTNAYSSKTYEVEKTIKEKAIKCQGFIKQTFKQWEGHSSRQEYYLKNKDSFIEMSFKLPEPEEHIIICRDNLQIKVLNGIVSGDVLMMLNAGDVEGAIDRISCDKGSEDNIIDTVTKRLEQKIKDFKEELEIKKTKDYVTPKAKQEALERSQKKIQETRQKIKSIEERIKGAEFCEICYDDFTKPAVTGCCQNVFCFECLAVAISGKNVCPKCRDSLTLENIMIIKENKEEEKEEKKRPIKRTAEIALKEIEKESQTLDKYSNFDKIMAYKKEFFTKEKQKILIFSEYEGSFNKKVTDTLEKNGFRYGRIKGTSASINKTLRQFRGVGMLKGEEEIDVLLINSRFFGAGLNLEIASDVILCHAMRQDLMMQVLGRAQRLGRKFHLNIWKLYHNNENYSYSS